MTQAPYGNHMRLDEEVSEASLTLPGSGTVNVDAVAKREKKKVFILVALFLVGIGVVAYQFLRAGGPQMASAQPLSASGDVSGGTDIEAVLGITDAAAKKEAFTVGRVEQLVKEFDTYAQSRQVPLKGLRTNPFRVAADSAKAAAKVAEQQSEVDAEAARQKQLQAVADNLKVSSVLVAGTRSLAVVNGQVCRVGDVVEGFRIDAIEADRVKLSADGFSLELKLFGDASAVPPSTKGYN